MTDPFDALRLPRAPLAPDPRFAADLRARLERALSTSTSTNQEEPMPDVIVHDDLSRHGTRAGDVSYITLAVPDAGRARAFYASVLGWTFRPGRAGHDASQVDGVIPEVGLWGDPQPERSTVHGAVLGFRVDDVAAAAREVEARGGSVDGPRREPYGLVADCEDDQGLAFYLHELPAAGRPAPPNGARPGDISYVSIVVDDTRKARDFFAAVLGWRYAPGRTDEGTTVEGTTPMMGIGRATDGRPPGAVLSYLVDDLAAAVARIRAAGGTATDPSTRPYGLEADCRDDQQTPFYLHQFPS